MFSEREAVTNKSIDVVKEAGRSLRQLGEAMLEAAIDVVEQPATELAQRQKIQRSRAEFYEDYS